MKFLCNIIVGLFYIVIQEKREVKMVLKVFEAFAGVGSQRMALRNIGIDHEVVGIAEINKYALQAYEAIHGDCPNYGDISKIDPHTLPDMDLFTYSFPCQDLSNAGKQKGLVEGTRSGLLYECEKVIEAKRPKYLLLENVKALVGDKFKNEFDEWLKYLENLGYTNYWEVLNSKNYGIPQNRERVFVVSVLDGEKELYSFEQPRDLTVTVGSFLERNADHQYYLSAERIEKIKKWSAFQKPLDNVLGTQSIVPTLTARGAGEFHSGMIIIDENEKKTYNYEVKEKYFGMGTTNKLRRITPKECWLLMGFTAEDYDKAKASGLNNTQLYKQAGNSIVVPVLEAIFRPLFEQEKDS